MPDITVFLTFILAVLALQTMPGPDMMLVISRAVGQGRREGLFVAAGVAAAGVIQLPALVLGAATIIHSSPFFYTLLKSAGALYLLYIGIRLLINSSNSPAASNEVINSYRTAFFQGFLSNLLNPKVVIFMLAFLPQFVDPAKGSVANQLMVLGVIMKCSGFLVNGSIAIMSNSMGRWFALKKSFVIWQQRLVGSLIIALGLRLLLDRDLK